MSVSVYVAATVAVRSVDLCMFDRSERRILDRSFDVQGLHYTWRDGEKQHLRAESGDLANTTFHNVHEVSAHGLPRPPVGAYAGLERVTT